MDQELRERAEAFINANPVDTPAFSTLEVQKLFRELDVKQVELAMQNKELRSAIAELKATCDAYATLYNAAPVGYFTVDRSSTIISTNGAAARMFGMDRARLVDLPFSDFVHRDYREEWIRHCREVFSGDRDYAIDIKLHRSDGSTFMAQVICRPQPSDIPLAWQCFVILIDITARKDAEEALRESRKEMAKLNRKLEERVEARTAELRESEARFRALFNESPDAAFILDLDGKLIDGNDAKERQVGYRRSELIGQSVFESPVFPPPAREHARERMLCLSQGEQLEPTEYELVRKDGSALVVEVTTRLVQIGGEPVCLCNSRDLTDRKQAEKALRMSEEKYRNLFQNLIEEVHFWQLVRDEAGAIKTWRLVDINPAGLRGWGKTREEAIGLTADEIFPDATQHFMPIVQKIFTEGRPYAWESYFPALEQHLKMTSVPLGDHFITTGYDITELKKTEQALRESEERFRKVYEHSAIGIAIKDWQGRILQCNPAFCALVGYSEDELRGVEFMGLVHPADRADNLTMLNRLKVGELPFFEIENRYIHKSGAAMWVHKFISILPDASAKPARLLALVSDITDRRNREQALRESEERYRRLFEAETDAILIFNGKTRRFIDVNEAAVRLYGYTRAEFLQMRQSDITAEPEASEKTIREALKGERSTIAFRLHRKKDGTIFPVEIARFIFDWTGQPVACGVIRDITERMAKEDELHRNREEMRRLASELSLANQRERQQISGELHDGLSQLLSSASLWLDSVSDAQLDENVRHPIQKVREIVGESLKLTRSLTFELSCPMLKELGLGAALEELCSSMSSEHCIRFQFFGDREPLPMHLDRQMVLYRATRELLINALKHSGAEAARVSLERTDQHVRICVSDEGRGFDASLAGQGFSPTGGFGLFNIREYINHMAGTLAIHSEPDSGTQVVLEIPMEEG